MSEYKGIFRAKYGARLKGRADWIKTIEPEDARVLIDIGLRAFEYGKIGGKKRAATAKRDARGHFARKDGTNKLTGIDPVKGTCQDEEAWKF